MSRASTLLHRLDHIREPSLDEQDPNEMSNDDDDNVAMRNGEGEEEIRGTPGPNTPPPTSPFSRETHNPDGSLKVDQNDQTINDRGSFTVRRKR